MNYNSYQMLQRWWIGAPAGAGAGVGEGGAGAPHLPFLLSNTPQSNFTLPSH